MALPASFSADPDFPVPKSFVPDSPEPPAAPPSQYGSVPILEEDPTIPKMPPGMKGGYVSTATVRNPLRQVTTPPKPGEQRIAPLADKDVPERVIDALTSFWFGGLNIGDTLVSRATASAPSSPDLAALDKNAVPLTKTPLVRPEALAGDTRGPHRAILEAAGGLTTPENAAILAGMGLLGKGAAAGGAGSRAISKALSSGFSVQMLQDALSSDPEWADAQGRGDTGVMTEIATRKGLALLLGMAAGAHALSGAEPLPRPAEPVARPMRVSEPRLLPAPEELPAAQPKALPAPEPGPVPPSFIPDKPYAQPERTAAEPAREPVAAGVGANAGAAESSTSAPAPIPAARAPQPAPLRPAPEQREVAPRRPAVEPAYGRNTAIAVPGEPTSYPARYAIREAGDVEASHNAFSFEPNPRYEYQNDRDYRTAQNAARVAENAAPGTFNPEFISTESPTAEHGAPVIDERGNVLGGNSRTMSLGRVYESNPQGAEAYRAALRERAQSLGIAPKELNRFQRPVLVRELAGQLDTAGAQRAITDFNKTGAAALSPAEQAVTDGRRLSPRTVEAISGKLENVGEGSTLAQAVRGDNGAEIVNSLVKDGVLTPQERNGLIDERGQLTPEAKDRVAKMLTGRLFEGPAQFAATPPEIRNKLERVAPQVLRLEGRPEWNLTPAVREAVGALADARAHGIRSLDDLARQQTIGAPRNYSPESIAIAKTLQSGPLAAERAFRQYANDEALSREGAQASFFEPPIRQEAFEAAFGPARLTLSKPLERPFRFQSAARQYNHAAGIHALASAAEVQEHPVEGSRSLVLITNSQAADVLTRLAGDPLDANDIIAATIWPLQIDLVRERLETLLDPARTPNLPAAARQKYRKLHAALERAGDQPLVVVHDSPFSEDQELTDGIQEELDHLIQWRLGGGPDTRGHAYRAGQFLRSAIAQRAAEALKQAGYYDDPENLTAEIGVRLARTGRYQELGLSAQDARDLAADYVRRLRRAQRVRGKSGREAKDLAERIFQAFKGTRSPSGKRPGPQNRGPEIRGPDSEAGGRRGGGTPGGAGPDVPGDGGDTSLSRGRLRPDAYPRDYARGPEETPRTALSRRRQDERGAVSVDFLTGGAHKFVTEDVAPTLAKTAQAIRSSFSLKPAQRSIVEEGSEYAARPTAFRAAIDFLRPVESRIADQGPQGKKLAGKLARARDVGEVDAGKRIVRLHDSGLTGLEQADRENLLDVLEGRAEPKNEAVRKAFDGIREVTDEIAREATGARVQVKEKRTARPGEELPEGAKLTGKQQDLLAAGKKIPFTYVRPFRAREHFYPHVIPSPEALKSGAIRKDVIDNLVRQGVRPDAESSAQFVETYRAFIDKGGRAEALEKFLVDSGQARNKGEAYMLLTRFRHRHIQRQGSLEYARQVDLPFYDPNPLRVLPPFVHSASLRLAQIREFGQGNEQINALIRKIDKAGGNAAFVRAAVDRILRVVDEPDTGVAKLARTLRVLQGFKLGLSAIPNVTQGALNSLLASDLPSTIAGGRAVFSKAGWRLGMRSGASLEGVVNEMVRYAGGDSPGLSKFLKAVGFTGTEQANRVWAANAGLAYARRMLNRLKFNPRDARARKVLAELGLEPDELLKTGALEGTDVLLAAKRFSDLTQFRADVADLPFFASTPMGRVFFQFKQYVYGQTRLLHRELVEEFREGRFGRGSRALLILAVVFPLAGEAIQELRELLKGKPRKGGALARYFDDIGATGALGILQDLTAAGHYGRATEWMAGPTVGEVGETIESAVKDAEKGSDLRDPRKSKLLKQAYRRIPLLGPATVDRVFGQQGIALRKLVTPRTHQATRRRRRVVY